MTSSADSTSGGCGSADGIIFDPVNPDKWYCGGNPNVTSNQHLWSFTYHGNHSEPPESYEEGTALPLCNAGISNQPCVVGVDLTAGTDLGTLAHAFDANFQNDRFRDWYLVGVRGRQAALPRLAQRAAFARLDRGVRSGGAGRGGGAVELALAGLPLVRPEVERAGKHAGLAERRPLERRHRPRSSSPG